MEQPRWFGTDGIRGPANVVPLVPAVAAALGQTLVARAHRRAGGSAPLIVIGRDTRASGPMLAEAAAAGVAAAGGRARHYDVLPTPAVARLALLDGAHYALIISASHNRHTDNGLKIIGGDGFKLSDEEEAEIERELRTLLQDNAASILANTSHEDRPSPLPGHADTNVLQLIERCADAPARYVRAVQAGFSQRPHLAGLRVALDCANGAAFEVGPALLRALGADVHTTAATPDGHNINLRCGATCAETIGRWTRDTGAVAGIALDGDADRVILVDERGDIVDGDRLMTIIALDWLAGGRLPTRTVVATVMSNLGMELALRQAGITLLRTDVGDRQVVAEMRRGGHTLGGEQSGHIDPRRKGQRSRHRAQRGHPSIRGRGAGGE
jgi:phosphoglucosamine mutase